MALKTVQDSSLTSVANAIRVKAEIEGTLEFPTEFVSAIQNIPTGGGSVSVPPKEVNFYDYDGTITNSYTAEDFASLASLPKNPKHTGLTAQGWNWTLADAKAYVAKYGKLNIGQMYVTTSGDTEIDIQLGIGRNKPYLGCCPNGTVEIDWGDGSAHDTLTGTSTSTDMLIIQHTYPDTGEMFTIRLHMESGELGFRGSSSNTTGSQVIYNGTIGSTNGQRAYQNAVKEIRFGSHVTSINDYAFQYCYSLASVTIPESVTSISSNAFQYCYLLASVTIPEGVTSIGNYAFDNCTSLTSVTIPEGVTSIGSYAFHNCYLLASVTIPEGVTSISSNAFQYCTALTSVTIPEGVTSIGGYAFNACTSLVSVTIPEGVTSIGNYAFNACASLASVTIPEGVTSINSNAFRYCSSLAHLIFEPTTPPTAGSNAFGNLPSDIVVYVPAGTLSAYQAASNYSSISSKMVEMSA